MNAPLVSCIVPVYNGERFLAEALDSILAQTIKDLEVVVVDDGSEDRTAEVAARYAPDVAYLAQANQGSAAAKNAGLEVAQGDFVAFLDCDDVWLPQKLERQMARFQGRAELELCFTRFQNFWIPELAAEEERYRGHQLSKPSSAWSIGTLLARRSVFDRYGRFGDGLRGNENMLWFLRAWEAGATVEVIPDVLMRRRFHGANDSQRSQAHAVDLFLPIVRAWKDLRHKPRGKA